MKYLTWGTMNGFGAFNTLSDATAQTRDQFARLNMTPGWVTGQVAGWAVYSMPPRYLNDTPQGSALAPLAQIIIEVDA